MPGMPVGPRGSRQVGRVNFLCLSFPIFQNGPQGHLAVVHGEEEESEVSLATSKGAGLVPGLTSQPCLCRQVHSPLWISFPSAGGAALARDTEACRRREPR